MKSEPKASKVYEVTRGVLLDSSFAAHATTCERCALFRPEAPATAVHLCLEGSVLWKRDNVSQKPRERAERHDNYASKAQMKAAMRYKGE